MAVVSFLRDPVIVYVSQVGYLESQGVLKDVIRVVRENVSDSRRVLLLNSKRVVHALFAVASELDGGQRVAEILRCGEKCGLLKSVGCVGGSLLGGIGEGSNKQVKNMQKEFSEGFNALYKVKWKGNPRALLTWRMIENGEEVQGVLVRGDWASEPVRISSLSQLILGMVDPEVKETESWMNPRFTWDAMASRIGSAWCLFLCTGTGKEGVEKCRQLLLEVAKRSVMRKIEANNTGNDRDCAICHSKFALLVYPVS
jgi:hypothetical protein